MRVMGGTVVVAEYDACLTEEGTKSRFAQSLVFYGVWAVVGGYPQGGDQGIRVQVQLSGDQYTRYMDSECRW